ncbi:MAG: NADH-quinone oxidoreductase subunit H [Candidatus Methanomethylophilaceae archaeon]|nr:NADH-quinone oxidoreductase subunit H [Candidatus Methanomethylophilaceae archaeon]MDY5872632.1 complex I subunit 1 family protein [Candidatus Methanomethylophilaceae archaeon]
MAYSSILNWIINRDDWVNTVVNGVDYSGIVNMSPYAGYNLPYDIGVKIWESLGGLIAWLINLIFPGNPVSYTLVSDPVTNAMAIILMVVVIFAIGFVVNLTMIWQERKFLGRQMDRRGTMIGPLGYFQCLGDGLKTFMKENVAPRDIDKKIYWWGLTLVIGTSVLLACMIPLSPRWYIVDFNTGLLIIFAFFALAPFLIMCAGWAQNNKYSLIGGLRAAELMISYEVPMLILFAATVYMTGSFNIGDIISWQENNIWLIVPQILGFIVCVVCAVAESERVPFDLSEAEAELVEGWQTEYAGMKWGLIMLGDYFRGYVACALVCIMYLGGWSMPIISSFDWYYQYLPELFFVLKTCFVFIFFITARGALPRVRTDQIVNVGWKVLMPLAVVNLVITILVKWFIENGGVF